MEILWASRSAPWVVNQCIVYMSSVTGKDPGSLLTGTLISQFPVT